MGIYRVAERPLESDRVVVVEVSESFGFEGVRSFLEFAVRDVFACEAGSALH